MIITDIVAAAPHCPVAGVNVYVDVPTVAVLIVAGLHVPVIPFVEVVGNEGGVLFWQSEPTGLNAGVTCEVTTIFIVVGVPH